jgi:hypothetical protein
MALESIGVKADTSHGTGGYLKKGLILSMALENTGKRADTSHGTRGYWTKG